MSPPSTVTLPLVGLTMPHTIEISVVLPAPLGPSSAKISPRRISRLTFFSAWKPEAYCLDSPAMERMASCMGRDDTAPRDFALADGEWLAGRVRAAPPALQSAV